LLASVAEIETMPTSLLSSAFAEPIPQPIAAAAAITTNRFMTPPPFAVSNPNEPFRQLKQQSSQGKRFLA